MNHKTTAARLVLACLAAALLPVAALAQVTPPNFTLPFQVWHKGTPAVPASTTGSTWYVNGTTGNDANTGAAGSPFKTINKAISKLAAGDTILIHGGLYREQIDLGSAPNGTAAKPITIGSFGDGEVIIDGSAKVTGWTRVTDVTSLTQWKANIGFTAIAVVVNEVPLRQVTQSETTSAPPQGRAGVTDNSGKFWVNYSTSPKMIVADFGTTLGPTGDPNTADIVVPNNVGDAGFTIFTAGNSYYTFKGLTVRGSGSNGIYIYQGSNVTVDSCDVKFNGKAAIFADHGSNQHVLMSHAYQNVMINWPRGNNGNAEAGGGWPGNIVFQTSLNPVARGNVAHMNGGEGIITYGTETGFTSGGALFEQNVSYDNWSVQMYFDNQVNDISRQNYLFSHETDFADYIYVGGSSYPFNDMDKGSVCIMLADEENSSSYPSGAAANLSGTQVYNNVIAGCRIGVRDYSEGAHAIPQHGLKNTLIANNTIIMPFNDVSGRATIGIYMQNNGTRNTGSYIQNNIVYGYNSDALIEYEGTGVIPGVSIDYNRYFSTASLPFAESDGSDAMTFTSWKSAIAADTHSSFGDPLLVDVTAFRGLAAVFWDFSNARIRSTSPAIAAGSAANGAPTTDFASMTRPTPPSIGAFEPATFPTTSTLVSSFNPSTQGQSITFTATVSSALATGSYTFLDGATAICAAVAIAAQQAQCTTSALSVGPHSITAQYSGDGTYLLSVSAPVVQTVTAVPVALHKVDFDGDGNADLVFEDADGSVEIWLMNGVAVKASAKITPSAPGHIIPTTGDFNGDLKADLLFQRNDGSVEMWIMNGTTVTSTTVIMPISHGWVVAGVGDFDADGKSDILWKNADGTVGLWLMNGGTIKQRTSIIGAGAVSEPVHVGDFNGDGKADILWRSRYDGSGYMWVMNGLTPVDRGLIMPAGSWTVLQVADFNHDGRSDIVWQNTDGTVSIWTMNGRTIVTHAPVLGANALWTVTNVGDLDGDGNADLMWLSRDGSVGTWLMNGIATVSKKTQFVGATGWSIGAVADVNNDGKADLVWSNTNGQVDIWLMNGLNSSSAATLLPSGSTSHVVNLRYHQ
ncbi:MAG TPA: FG-GAP-like repeat-containing protein [Usitatibacter sp.]|jgi:hypothetical protein|nr:FG-GAP-like repeat-containing protein [Usitatibacter sp.]